MAKTVSQIKLTPRPLRLIKNKSFPCNGGEGSYKTLCSIRLEGRPCTETFETREELYEHQQRNMIEINPTSHTEAIREKLKAEVKPKQFKCECRLITEGEIRNLCAFKVGGETCSEEFDTSEEFGKHYDSNVFPDIVKAPRVVPKLDEKPFKCYKDIRFQVGLCGDTECEKGFESLAQRDVHRITGGITKNVRKRWDTDAFC